jgi:hypothetical protein
MLEPDNPYNTNMYDERDGRILYQVMTENRQETVTYVKNMEGETIAYWQWRDPRPEVITLGNSAPVPVSAWLKKSIMPFKDTVTFRDQLGRQFKWKAGGTGPPLELFSEDDKRQPIAYFEASRTVPMDVWDLSSTGPRRVKARLWIDSRGFQMLDLIVISFLLLEKHRRAELSTTSMSAT